MKLSVCILAWNNLPTLKKTMHILAEELSGVDHEIILVDQASTDGTVEYLKDYFIKIIANEQNTGISKGKNQCVENAKGTYILLLDGDVVPVPGSILCLLDYMEQNLECQAVGFRPNRGIKGDNGNHAESECKKLVDPRRARFPCLYYGMFLRTVFDRVKCDETGAFAGEGYGYEDLDFYRQMEAAGIDQWMVEINKVGGRYPHEVNSSIRNMGRDKYMETSMKRYKQFKDKWQ